MDQRTFDELLKDGDIDLILMDGGKNLTQDQMTRVKEIAKQQSRERLLEMAQQLARTEGYEDFVKLPLVSSIMSGKKKPAQSTLEQKPKQDKLKKQAKDPNRTNISEGVIKPLAVKDSLADIFGKMYNFMEMKRDIDLKKFVEDQKYQKQLEEIKENRNVELIKLFAGKKPKKKKKKKEESKKEEPAKAEEKPEAPKKTSETKPAQTKPTETKPAQTKPAETTKAKPAKTEVPARTVERTPPSLPETPPATAIKPPPVSTVSSTATKVAVGTAATVAAASSQAGLLPILNKAESSSYDQLVFPYKGRNAPSTAPLTTMTVAEVIAYQEQMDKSKNYPSNAVGKYQMVRSTIKEGAEKLNISLNHPFDKDTQDRLYREYLTGSKRKNLDAFLSGKSDDLAAAQLDMAKEFESFGVPQKVWRDEAKKKNGEVLWDARYVLPGQSYYTKTGKMAAVSPEQSAKALVEERYVRTGKKPPANVLAMSNVTGEQLDKLSVDLRTSKQQVASAGTQGAVVALNTTNVYQGGTTIQSAQQASNSPAAVNKNQKT
jgi:hypothetical protein